MRRKPDTARFHVRPATEPPLYYVALTDRGPVITSSNVGGIVLVGPVPILTAVDAYVKAGGVGYALGLEE